MNRKRRKTGELEVFKEIWAERKNHTCGVCGRRLLGFSVWYFAHVIPKGHYGKFRLRRKNIEVLCDKCHHTYDHETDKAKADPRFAYLFKKAEQLSRQYNRMLKSNFFYLHDI